jgi:hypothetical protein
MKETANVKFHNRFDIEVRDAKTGDLKQRAKAENIVLDSMYTRLCAFSNYFVNIHFGIGTGIPTPDGTALFSHLGTKTAITEEILKSYPTSKWTRYIQLEPSEYVGSTITEVGIAYGSTNTYLVTHAMIKDSEGNPLSIEKTDLDVIKIYATVYITLSNSEHIYFTNLPANNFILNRLFHEGSEMKTLQIGSSSKTLETSKNSCDCMLSSIAMDASADTANKKRKWSKRLEVTHSNHPIQELGLQNGFRVLLGNTPTWDSFYMEDIKLETIEGETNKFAILHPRPQNIIVKVDGVPTTSHIIDQHSLDYPGLSLANVCENLVGSGTVSSSILSFEHAIYHGTAVNYTDFGPTSSSPNGTLTMDVKEEFREMLVGAVLEAKIIGPSDSTSTIGFEASYDGETFESLGSFSIRGATRIDCSHPISEPPAILRIKGTGSSYTSARIYWVHLKAKPPAIIEILDETDESSSVTASFSLTSIPKDEDHVLDVAFELQYGEEI